LFQERRSKGEIATGALCADGVSIPAWLRGGMLHDRHCSQQRDGAGMSPGAIFFNLVVGQFQEERTSGAKEDAEKGGATNQNVPQGLKPHCKQALLARLKPCP
jgi:hypothetical protein